MLARMLGRPCPQGGLAVAIGRRLQYDRWRWEPFEQGIEMMRALLLSVALIGLLPSPCGASVIYVDDDAPLGGDGLTWDTAFSYLQDALAVAQAGDDIRVAQGTYKPDQDEAGNVTPGDREATFQLVNNVAIYGGYAGLGAADPNERDIALYETVLSGDLAGDDQPSFVNYEENSLHVLTSGGCDPTALLDGVAIAAGNSDQAPYNERGAGLLCTASSPTLISCGFFENRAAYGAGVYTTQGSALSLISCVLVGNLATGWGGGLHNHENSDSTVTACTFTGNVATLGGAIRNDNSNPLISDSTLAFNYATLNCGGIYNAHSSPAIERCTFVNNSAHDNGGAMINHGPDSDPSITGCRFLGNSADFYNGGAMCNWDGSNPSIVNCVFTGNTAATCGGAMKNEITGSPTMTNCAFVDNSAGTLGGAIASGGSSGPVLANCIVWGNSDSTGSGESAQFYFYDSAFMIIDFSCVEGWTGAFGGTGNIGSDPLFVGAANGDYRLSAGSPCIDAGDNTGVPPEVTTDLDGNPRFVVTLHPSARFSENSAV